MGDEFTEQLLDFIDWLEWKGYAITEPVEVHAVYYVVPRDVTMEDLVNQYVDDIENDGDVLD